ncbi:MAG: hypothetical protein ABL883_10600 [Terricaulis sp.]
MRAGLQVRGHKLRWAPIMAFFGAMALAACGEPAPNPYPAEARAHFESTCPPASAACACTWDKITRSMTYEEYEAALVRMRERGNMDPRVTRARGACLEQHPS